MRCLIIASIAATLLVPSLALGGSAGNPASNVGKENFGCSFEIENQVKSVDQDLTTSKRWLGKLTWGAADRIDIYAKLGASDLRVDVASTQDYEGKRGMTWGGGARCMVAEIERPKIATYMDLQMLSFHTKGTVWKSFESDGYVERYDNRYKWNEVQFSFVAVWQREIFTPYVGFGITNVFGNVEKTVYRISGNVGEFYAHQTNDFREDAIPELILGVDFGVGGTGHLSGEIRYSEEEDISFFVGASELWRLK
ncbi:MAG: hypothetical protein V1694_06835 [Candidatus Eisenbacteria bacterium]